jgi:hypothetical protein
MNADTNDVQRATRQVELLLSEHGILSAVVDAVGFQREIAALRVPLTDLERVAELANEIKKLGFRYVAVDLMEQRA